MGVVELETLMYVMATVHDAQLPLLGLKKKMLEVTAVSHDGAPAMQLDVMKRKRAWADYEDEEDAASDAGESQCSRKARYY